MHIELALTGDTTDVVQLSVLTSKVLRSFPKSTLISLVEVGWIAFLAEVLVNHTVTESPVWLVVVGCCIACCIWFGTIHSRSLWGITSTFSILYYA